jgi:hypothetical protein
MYFDRMDICEAWYLFAANYHEGQWSKTYQTFERLDSLGFKPSPMLRYESLSENGQAIYSNLVSSVSEYR